MRLQFVLVSQEPLWTCIKKQKLRDMRLNLLFHFHKPINTKFEL